MKNHVYDKLKNHIGHNIVCVAYNHPYANEWDAPVDICIECEDCGEVLVSAEAMSERIIIKSFKPDFAALYDVIGNNQTKYGFYICRELYDSDYYYDLCCGRYDDNVPFISRIDTTLVTDCTWCDLLEEHDDYVLVGTNDDCEYKEFKLSIDEFHTVCNGFVPYYIDENRRVHDLDWEDVDW